jgi:GDP-L-fucose synthase
MTNIIITGASGFLGQHLLAHLRTLGHDPYGATRQAYDASDDPWEYPLDNPQGYDLRNPDHLDALFRHTGKPDIIFHLAANVGGIQYNLANPGAIFYDNVMMTTQLIHKAMLKGCGKFVMVGSVCSYPANNPIPTKEHRLFEGQPEASNGPYGLAKLMALTQLQAYRQQHGLNFAYPVLANLYGPGDGGFSHSTGHVLPNLIKSFVNSKEEVMVFRGDGRLSRDFLYVKDAACALAKFIDIDYCEPVNIATGREYTKRQIVEIIAALIGYKGDIVFDGKFDLGQLRRCYDTDTANKVLGWRYRVDIKDGLKRTIEWYKASGSP